MTTSTTSRSLTPPHPDDRTVHVPVWPGHLSPSFPAVFGPGPGHVVQITQTLTEENDLFVRGLPQDVVDVANEMVRIVSSDKFPYLGWSGVHPYGAPAWDLSAPRSETDKARLAFAPVLYAMENTSHFSPSTVSGTDNPKYTQVIRMTRSLVTAARVVPGFPVGLRLPEVMAACPYEFVCLSINRDLGLIDVGPANPEFRYAIRRDLLADYVHPGWTGMDGPAIFSLIDEDL